MRIQEDVDGGGEGGDLFGVEEMDLIALEEDENAIVPVHDTTLVEARQRAKDYMTRTKAKPYRGEDEDTFADRIAKIMFLGNKDRKTQRSQMKTNHRVGETTMTTEEVGAAAEARKLYSEIKGTKKQRPWNSLGRSWKRCLARQSVGSSNVGTMTLDMVAKTTTTRMMKATCANLKDLWRIMKR